MNITVTLNQPPAPPSSKKYSGFRALHKIEGGRDIPTTPALPHPPAVIPVFNPTVKLKMTESIQRLSYDLMKHFCDGLTPKRWRAMHGDALAMCNNTGFDGNPYVARRDYIGNMDLSAAEYPYYDKMQRTFQGSFISGKREGSLIYCNPSIDAIDARGLSYIPGTPEAAELLNTVIEKAWYSIAVMVGDPPFHFRPLWGGVIVYPFVLDRQVTFLAEFFEPWEQDYLPDPLKVYG